jgi:hypothetical protein
MVMMLLATGKEGAKAQTRKDDGWRGASIGGGVDGRNGNLNWWEWVDGMGGIGLSRLVSPFVGICRRKRERSAEDRRAGKSKPGSGFGWETAGRGVSEAVGKRCKGVDLSALAGMGRLVSGKTGGFLRG